MEQQKIVGERIISRLTCLRFYNDDIEECTNMVIGKKKKICGKLAKASYNNCMENVKDIATYTIYNTDKPEH